MRAREMNQRHPSSASNILVATGFEAVCNQEAIVAIVVVQGRYNGAPIPAVLYSCGQAPAPGRAMDRLFFLGHPTARAIQPMAPPVVFRGPLVWN